MRVVFIMPAHLPQNAATLMENCGKAPVAKNIEKQMNANERVKYEFSFTNPTQLDQFLRQLLYVIIYSTYCECMYVCVCTFRTMGCISNSDRPALDLRAHHEVLDAGRLLLLQPLARVLLAVSLLLQHGLHVEAHQCLTESVNGTQRSS